MKNSVKKLVISTNHMLNLLAHAQIEETDIGSECGGHGRCGKDRVIIPLELQKQYFNAPTPIEEKHLGSELMSKGYRLGCQCYPNVSGIEITIKIP